MLLPIITKAVSRRLSDEAISVRETAVSLVGGYAVLSPLAIQSYHAALLPCLTDKGVSVRKKAVQIFQKILIKNPRYKGRSAVCNILLERSADPKEEDGVRDRIDDLFCLLWLRDCSKELLPEKKRSDSMDEDPPTAGSSEQAASIPGVVTPSSPIVANKRKKPQRRGDVAAEQMMEVVKTAGTGDTLEALLKKLLSGSIDSDNSRKQSERQKRQELGQKQCTTLVDSLFELLMVVEEQRDIRPHVGKDIAATLLTIGVFATVAPHPVLKHLDTFLIFLKADNGVSLEDETAIVCATCDIVYRLSSAFDHNALVRLSASSVATDLTKICYKFGPAALSSAIRAFSSLAHHPEAGDNARIGEKLLRMAKTFYKYLVSKSETQDFSASGVSASVDSCCVQSTTELNFFLTLRLFPPSPHSTTCRRIRSRTVPTAH